MCLKYSASIANVIIQIKKAIEFVDIDRELL